MARLWAEKLGSALSDAVGREDSERNRESLSALNAAVAEKIAQARKAGGSLIKIGSMLKASGPLGSGLRPLRTRG